MFKIILAAAVVALVYARPQHGQDGGHDHAISSQRVSLHAGHDEQKIVYHGHPKYKFEYQVKDPHTHDLKSHQEHRDGYKVQGEYSLHQPDGTIRIVKYDADKKTGFHASVKYKGHAKHIVPEHH